jgi:hypothetical protein
MISSKKILHSLTRDGKATSRGEHLVPCLSKSRENVFIGVKTGKKHQRGYICYLGEELSPDDVLRKLGMSGDAAAESKPVLEAFFQQLARFKIGNVLEITFPGPNSCMLEKVAERPQSDLSKLP